MKNKVFMVGMFSIMLVFGTRNILSAQTVSLDEAIKNIAQGIEEKLEEGVKIVVWNFNSSSERLSDYIVDELTTLFINNGKLIVVDRKNLSLIDEEIDYQMSGEVDEETIQEIGHKLGAESIVFGFGEDMGDYYHIRFRTLEVARAVAQSQLSQNVTKDDPFERLIQGNKFGKGAVLSTKKFVFGGQLGAGFGLNSLDSEFKKDYFEPDVKSNTNFLASVYGTYNVNTLFAVQVEFNFMINNGVTIDGYDQVKLDEEDNSGEYVWDWDECEIDDKFTYVSLDIPLLARFNFRPKSFLLVSGLIGPYFSIPLGDLKNKFEYPNDSSGNDTRDDKITNVMIGILAGINVGYNLGPGYITAGFRFMNNFNPVKADYWDEREVKIFTRRVLSISLGYEIWF
jgi:hypothetical protein